VDVTVQDDGSPSFTHIKDGAGARAKPSPGPGSRPGDGWTGRQPDRSLPQHLTGSGDRAAGMIILDRVWGAFPIMVAAATICSRGIAANMSSGQVTAMADIQLTGPDHAAPLGI